MEGAMNWKEREGIHPFHSRRGPRAPAGEGKGFALVLEVTLSCLGGYFLMRGSGALALSHTRMSKDTDEPRGKSRQTWP